MAKENFEALIHQINSLLKKWEIFPTYDASISKGKNEFKIFQTYTKKNYDTDWIKNIEDCLVALDTIVRNPRKFIVIEEDIVDISLARSISVESVKHLSQHTNLISSVTKDGMVIPSKILNTSKEESFEVYENRFIYTLLLKIRDFIDRRFTIIKSALLQAGDLGVDLQSEFSIDGSKIKYGMKTEANFPFDAVVKRRSNGELTDVERITRMNGIINDFLSSPFAKEMRSCSLVRPPIQRTNVILKDPNFKKALVLWQYIESNERMSFDVENVQETADLNPILSEKYRAIIFLNTVLLQSISNNRTEGESLEGSLNKESSFDGKDSGVDDFVPDDYPGLKLKLTEIRNIYESLPFADKLTIEEQGKLNKALDRIIRQIKINKAKDDVKIQQNLIAEQIEGEKQAKRLALRYERQEKYRQDREMSRQKLALVRIEKARKMQLMEAERLKQKEGIEARRLERMALEQRNANIREVIARKESIMEKEAYLAKQEEKTRRYRENLKARQESLAKNAHDVLLNKKIIDTQIDNHSALIEVLDKKLTDLDKRIYEQERISARLKEMENYFETFKD